MRHFINIITETSVVEDDNHDNNFFFASEADVTEDDLRQIYDGLVFIASKYRSGNLGAAAFYHLVYEDKIAYFNKVILPIYEAHRYPRPNKEPYLVFQTEIERMWSRLNKAEGVDYLEYDNIKKLMGV